MYYVYILRCEGDNLYTGITTDVPRRVRQHLGQLAGGAKYTATHRPRAIAMVWSAPDRAAASRLEYGVKHLSRREKDRLLAEPARLADLCPQLDGALYAVRPDLMKTKLE